MDDYDDGVVSGEGGVSVDGLEGVGAFDIPGLPSASVKKDPYSGFAAMQANPLPGEGEEEEDDEIVQELPVVLSQELAGQLYLFQSPLRPPHRPYEQDLGKRVSLRVKPIQKRVEMEYKLETQPKEDSASNYDGNHDYPVKKFVLTARPVAPKTNYCVGVLRGGILHLTPLHAVARLKPNLSYIDQQNTMMAEESERKRELHRLERQSQGLYTEEDELEEAERQAKEDKKDELQTVVFKVKKKEKEGSGALAGVTFSRRSHAYIKQIEEKEPWVDLRVYEQDSTLTRSHFRKLLSNAAAPTIPFNVPAQDYLAYVNPPDKTDSSIQNFSKTAAGDESMTLEERLLTLMRSARVITFGDICLTLSIRDELSVSIALRELSLMAYVIQGCWVVKSAVVYDRFWRSGVVNSTRYVERVELCRDYLLTQLAKQRVVSRDELHPLFLIDDVEIQEGLLKELCVPLQQAQINEQASKLSLLRKAHGLPPMGPLAYWEFREITDHKFIQFFPRYAQASAATLDAMEQDLRIRLDRSNSVTGPASSVFLHSERFIGSSSSSSSGVSSAALEAVYAHTTEGKEKSARDQARQFLYSLFEKHGVVSTTFVTQIFRAFSASREGQDMKRYFKSDNMVILLEEEGLRFGQKQDLFIRKNKSPQVDAYRSVVASLFSQHNEVKKADIRNAVITANIDDVHDKVYREVMGEFATFDSSRGVWVLKSGSYM